MVITAIYFKDEDCCHLKIRDSYFCADHLLVNGNVFKPNSSWKDSDIIVEGKVIDVKSANKKVVTSHYLNRETEETMSVQIYNDSIKSFKKDDGEYKDLESEYLCRKMEQTYIPVYRTYYEYEDIPVMYEDAECKPDEYCECTGLVRKSDGEKPRHYFVFSFDKWKFANDTVKRLMEEYGIKRVESIEKGSKEEYYILHDKEKKYQWLEFCGNEYFINYDDMFPKYDNKSSYVYGSYQGVLDLEKEIEKKLRDKIEYKLDCVRTVNIKKSAMRLLEEKLKDIIKSAENKNFKRRDLTTKIRLFYHDLSNIANK